MCFELKCSSVKNIFSLKAHMVKPQKDANASLENVDKRLGGVWLRYLFL